MLPEHGKLQVFSMASFIAIRVIENLIREFTISSSLKRTAKATIASSLVCSEMNKLQVQIQRLCLLWEDTCESKQKDLLSNPLLTKTRIQRILNKKDGRKGKFALDIAVYNERNFEIAADQVIESLDNNVLNDAVFVAETLYTSTLTSVTTCADQVAREIGYDLQVSVLYWLKILPVILVD